MAPLRNFIDIIEIDIYIYMYIFGFQVQGKFRKQIIIYLKQQVYINQHFAICGSINSTF